MVSRSEKDDYVELKKGFKNDKISQKSLSAIMKHLFNDRIHFTVKNDTWT
jgi:hypothetical protein